MHDVRNEMLIEELTQWVSIEPLFSYLEGHNQNILL